MGLGAVGMAVVVMCESPQVAVLAPVLSIFPLQVNPDISFEVFIHKVDGLSDDHKIGMSTESIQSYVN